MQLANKKRERLLKETKNQQEFLLKKMVQNSILVIIFTKLRCIVPNISEISLQVTPN